VDIAPDKKLHIAAGALVGIVAVAVLRFRFPNLPAYSLVCLGTLCAAIVGTAKEVYDHFHPATHTADIYDMLATTLGGVAGSIATNIVIAYLA
jgi:VanZ family protein